MVATSKLQVADIPAKKNKILCLALLSTQAYLLFFFPTLRSLSPALAVAVLVLTTLAVLPSWYLMHEAIHGMISPSRKMNLRMGRVLGVATGVPFTGVRVAHLLHHRFNRVEELAEVYDSGKTNFVQANVKHFAALFGGLYWIEFVGCIATFLPLSARQWIGDRLAENDPYMRRFSDAVNLRQSVEVIRVDTFAVLLLYWAAFHFCPAEFRGSLICALFVRAALVSLFDNSFHYGTARNQRSDPSPALNHSFRFSSLILYFNYHGLHHEYPNLPWTELGKLARQNQVPCANSYVMGALHQLRGAIPSSELDALPAHLGEQTSPFAADSFTAQ